MYIVVYDSAVNIINERCGNNLGCKPTCILYPWLQYCGMVKDLNCCDKISIDYSLFQTSGPLNFPLRWELEYLHNCVYSLFQCHTWHDVGLSNTYPACA